MKKVFLLLPLLISCSNDDNDLNCFSPTQNLESACEVNSVGCDCNSAVDEGVCVMDKNGQFVALICSEDKWTAVEDGPCSGGALGI